MSNKINKLKNKEIRKRLELEKEMSEHFDTCYCEQLLHEEPIVDFINDKVVETIKIDNYPYHGCKDYEINYYLCKRCNKKTNIKIAF